MITAWRIVPKNWVNTAFDGEGARLYGGRWNSPGLAAVYLADSRALAALEVIVHLNPAMAAQQYQIIEVSFPTRLVQEIDIQPLATALASPCVLPATQHAGDAWLTAARAPVLKVYSSIIAEEPNYVLNPKHPQFDHIKIGTARPFAFAPQLLLTSKD
jgi:RES domain-containing protein